MMAENWPSNQKAWDLLAADWTDMQQQKRTAHWEALKAEHVADADLFEPISPEQEETLF